MVTCLVALMSEMLVGALESASHQLGLTQVFVGVILVAIVGNAAKHSTAVIVAMKNKMDLAYGIAVGPACRLRYSFPHYSSLPVTSSGRRWI
jgi:Ca2+:H+ antiporter